MPPARHLFGHRTKGEPTKMMQRVTGLTVSLVATSDRVDRLFGHRTKGEPTTMMQRETGLTVSLVATSDRVDRLFGCAGAIDGAEGSFDTAMAQARRRHFYSVGRFPR